MQRLSLTILFVLILAFVYLFFSLSTAEESVQNGCQDGESPFLVLLYHRVTKGSKGTHYAIPEKILQDQMRWLKNNGYRSIRIKDAYEALSNNKPLPQKSVLITFDDNYSSDYQIAAPILEKYGFRGLFFIISSKVDSRMKARYMELKTRGHEIGSHSVTHAYMTKRRCRKPSQCCGSSKGCTPKQIYYELTKSMSDLNELLGETKAFAWPGNYYNTDSIMLAEKAGYKLQFACDKLVYIRNRAYGIPGTTTNPNEIFRVEIDGRASNINLFIEAVQHQRPLVLSKSIFWKYSVPNYRKNCSKH